MAAAASVPVVGMDLVKNVKELVDRMVNAVPGIKVMLLDDETMGIIGLVYSRTEILAKEVFFIDKLSSPREVQKHMKCIVFVRPTHKNVERLVEELKTPKYSEYHFFFNNILDHSGHRVHLENLASNDVQETVKGVHEHFMDFYALKPNLFTLGVPSIKPLWLDNFDHDVFNRISTGLLSVCLSLKRRPMVRYQHNSSLCQKLARDIGSRIQDENALFDFRRNDSCLLLIFDRREDPVTPILTQWTYEAMVHEIFGIHSNRVKLPEDKTAAASANDKEKKEDDEVVLSKDADKFWSDNMHNNWGELCMNIKHFVDEYKNKSDAGQGGLKSLEDMKKFMRDFPAYRMMGANVTKHMRLVSFIGDEIRRRRLMEVSVQEQEMACNEAMQEHYARLIELLESVQDPYDAVRLLMIYSLRYEGNPRNNINNLKSILRPKISAELMALVDAVTFYGGRNVRQTDLFGNQSNQLAVTRVTGFLKDTFKEMKDVQNVYAQHQPLAVKLLNDVSQGKLDESKFPYQAHLAPPPGSGRMWVPKEVIVFIVGGATYEEEYHLAQFSKNSAKPLQVLLGGTTVLNSKKFLEELTDLALPSAPGGYDLR